MGACGSGLRAACLVVAVAAVASGNVASATASELLAPYAVEPFQSDLATYSIAVSREGFVWLAAQGQVARWDGRQLHTLAARVADADSPGHRVAIAGNGTVWIALGLELYPPGAGPRQIPRPGWPNVRLMWSRDGRWSHFQSGHEVLPGPLHALAADDDGAWLGTNDGLRRFANGRLEAIADLPPALIGVPVLALATTPDELFVGTATALARRRAGRWTVDELGARVQAIAPLANGSVAVGTDAGLILVQNQRARRVGPADDVRAVVEADGALWLATPTGIAVVNPDGSVVRSIGMAEGLPDANVLALGRDRDGTIWVGTASGGVVTVARRTLWNLGRRDGLPSDATTSVLRARDGRIWIATSAGVAVTDGTQLASFHRGHELPDAEPRGLAEAPDGAIAVATRGAGVVRIDARANAPSVTHVAAVPWRDAGALTFDAAGDLWVGSATEGAIARVRGTGAVTTWSPREGACDAPVANAAALPDGTVWLGSSHAGLTRVTAQGARCFTHADGLPRDAIGALLVDGARLWIGLRFDGGIARWHDGRFVAIDSPRGLPCDSVHALVADGDGGLWTGCGFGVARLPTDALERAIFDGGDVEASASINVLDGMRAQSCTVGSQPGAALGPDGSVWFATPAGVTVVRLANAPVLPPPLPVVESLTLDGRVRDLADGIEATGSAVSLSAELAAPASRGYRRVMVEHRLVGADRDWVGSGDERTARYAQLGPGRYRLQVRASRDGKHWAEATAIDLRVLAPFHRRPPVLAALVVAFAALAYAAHRARLRTMARAHAVVQQERVRIARELHDGLGQSLSAAGFLLKAAEQKLEPGAGPDVEAARTIVANTRAVLARSYDEARRSTWYLRDPDASGRPLEHALREVVDAAVATAGAGAPAVELVVEGEPASDGADVRRELPAIAHEAITNALRHADARRIEVRLARSADALVLVVRDDGRGIADGADLAALRRHGHFGLLGIEERAARIEGAVFVGRAPGGGTEVRVTIAKARTAAGQQLASSLVPPDRRQA